MPKLTDEQKFLMWVVAGFLALKDIPIGTGVQWLAQACGVGN